MAMWMGSKRFGLEVALIVIIASQSFLLSQAANVFTVGDEQGWTLGFDYTAWAESKDFRVGDILVFKYAVENHNVVRVENGKVFADCISEPNLQVFQSGNDQLVLNEARNYWFVCGVPGHCESGMKVKISVTEAVTSVPAPAPGPIFI